MTESGKIAVLGGGAWGTALALALIRAGHRPTLWARDRATVESINKRHENSRYLPGIRLDEALHATERASLALKDCDCVLSVVPAQSLRRVLKQVRANVPASATMVLCAKGIERDSGKRLSEVAGEMLPGHPVAALSGPSFAADVARDLPTAVTVAADDAAKAQHLAQKLSSPRFRCYSSDDLIGVELGGALKNVLAIAAGATAGAGLGASAQAALVTRGFVELRRIAAVFGARPETVMGLSGFGDLILTCGSAQSRNFAYGLALGRGDSLDGLPLAEGVATAGVAATIAKTRKIEAPIIDSVDRILAGKVSIGAAIEALLSRPLKSES